MNAMKLLTDPDFYLDAKSIRKEGYELIVELTNMRLRINRSLDDSWSVRVGVYVTLPDAPEVPYLKTNVDGEDLESWKAIWRHLMNRVYEEQISRSDALMVKVSSLIRQRSRKEVQA